MADITKINLKGTLLNIKDQYAYHNGDLATVATSGSYNDLSDKPVIPPAADLTGYATETYVDTTVANLVDSAPQTLDTLNELAEALGDDPNFATTMATQLGNKVDKETGKGLSTNDYTTAEKTKLAGLENYDDSALQTAIDGKVDKETGKSLMTDAEHTKLAGIAAGAEVNVQPNWTQTNTLADDYIKNKPTLDNDIVGISDGTASDGAVVFSKRNGDTITLNFNHVHPQYLKYELLADEAAYTALSTKDSSTLYLIPAEEE